MHWVKRLECSPWILKRRITKGIGRAIIFYLGSSFVLVRLPEEHRSMPKLHIVHPDVVSNTSLHDCRMGYMHAYSLHVLFNGVVVVIQTGKQKSQSSQIGGVVERIT